ncbi:hypothetical protein ThvES_00007970 [Thiovulum sp. ES]|nr:hypothetical protein ThvES_00007970 [Thiovulum sp. ES]
MLRNGREIIPNSMIEEPTQFVANRSITVRGYKGFYVYVESTEDLFLFSEDVLILTRLDKLYSEKKLIKVS